MGCISPGLPAIALRLGFAPNGSLEAYEYHQGSPGDLMSGSSLEQVVTDFDVRARPVVEPSVHER